MTAKPKDHSKTIDTIKKTVSDLQKSLKTVTKTQEKAAAEKDEKVSPEDHQAALDHFASQYKMARMNKDEEAAKEHAKAYHDYSAKLSSHYHSKLKESVEDFCPECQEDPCVCGGNHINEEDKMVELGDLAKAKKDKHRFLVTYSDPHHTSVSMRKVKQQKHVKVPAWSKEHGTIFKGDAEPLVKKYMKKQGYKVHGVEHVGMVSEASFWGIDKLAKAAQDASGSTSSVRGKDEKGVYTSKMVRKKGEKDYKEVSREYDKPVKEDVEQVDELNKETLLKYMQKVSADSQKHKMDPSKRSAEKRNKSVAGFAKAFNKYQKEEVEQVDELKASTYTSYIDKVTDPDVASKRGKTPSGLLKSIKAITGVSRAIGKRAKAQMKEEIVNEVSTERMEKYKSAANKSANELMKKKAAGEVGEKEYETKMKARGKGIARALRKLGTYKNSTIDISGSDVQKKHYSGPSGSYTGD